MGEVFQPQRTAEIGQQFVGISDQFLTEQLGRAYTLPEIVQFAETAVATLIASAYTNFREAIGKDGAEAWVKKTLAVAASSVRLMGADALLKFEVHIKDMPNSLPKHRQEAQAPAKEAPVQETPKCKCKLFADGSCPLCVEKLAAIMSGTFKLMRDVSDNTRRLAEQCRVCNVTQTDRALVKLIPDLLTMKEGVSKENHQAFDQEMLAALHQLGSMAGAQQIPLTEKAWKEAIEE